MNADGSGQKNLTNNIAEDTAPHWSPDGKKIAFVSDRNRMYDIYIMNTDGSEQKNITNSPVFDGGARWSPDGKKIAFISGRPPRKIPLLSFFLKGKHRQYIGIVNPDGTGKKQLTTTGTDGSPVWSPVPLPTKDP